MNTTFDKIEVGAREKVREWIGDKGSVLYVWADNLSGSSLRQWTYYIVAAVPGTFDPSLQFLRVWSSAWGKEWMLSQDESLNLVAVMENTTETA